MNRDICVFNALSLTNNLLISIYYKLYKFSWKSRIYNAIKCWSHSWLNWLKLAKSTIDEHPFGTINVALGKRSQFGKCWLRQIKMVTIARWTLVSDRHSYRFSIVGNLDTDTRFANGISIRVARNRIPFPGNCNQIFVGCIQPRTASAMTSVVVVCEMTGAFLVERYRAAGWWAWTAAGAIFRSVAAIAPLRAAHSTRAIGGRSTFASRLYRCYRGHRSQQKNTDVSDFRKCHLVTQVSCLMLGWIWPVVDRNMK